MTTVELPLPATLTVDYILGLDDDETVSLDGKDEVPKEDLVVTSSASTNPRDYLQANGVVVSETETEENLQAVMHKMQARVGFWQTYASLHPNFKRVKNWLWVHDRYRAQAKDLTTGSTTAADFRKFHAKIEAHSKYEDTQLFQFFLDSKIMNITDALQKLTEQHSDIRTVAAIQQGYGNHKDKHKDVHMQPLLQEYVNDMLQHLDFEEKTIVGPWLQLTDEQYKKYRTYLSWKYCFMY